MKVFATSNGSVISTINASWHPLHYISGSKRGNHCSLDARVEKPPKMLKIGSFPQNVIETDKFLNHHYVIFLGLSILRRTRYGSSKSIQPFVQEACFVMKNLEILFPAWNSMGKFWKYFLILGYSNSETPWPNVPIKRLLERHSFLHVYPKNQLDCSISSTSYVMDNAHLCLGRTKKKKTKWNKTEFCAQNWKSRLILKWPWPQRNI